MAGLPPRKESEMVDRVRRLRRKAIMMLLASGLVMSALFLANTTPAQAACHNWTDFYYYYYDAAHTQYAGMCEYDCFCAPPSCSGTKTQFFRVQTVPGCL
jgi:hypothetical protein